MDKKSSLKDSTDKNWKVFEKLVISLFNKYFGESEIVFEDTQFVGDGGKDGVAEFKIASRGSVIPDLPFVIWLEAKYRTSNTKLNEYDIGGNIVIALFKHVHGLYVVTNREFTERSTVGITALGQRLNCQIYFIGRSTLVKSLEENNYPDIDTKSLRELLDVDIHPRKRSISTMFPNKSKPKPTKAHIKYTVLVRLTGSIESLPTSTPPQTFTMELGEPYFVTLDVLPDKVSISPLPDLQVASLNVEQLEVYPYHIAKYPVFSPFGYQSVYLFIALKNKDIEFGKNYNVNLNGIPKQQIQWDMPQCVLVKERLNINWAPPSWEKATKSLLKRLDDWIDDRISGLISCNIVAVAGYGKSFLVRKLRNQAIKRSLKHSQAILPITIDCKSVDGATRFVSLLFSHLFFSSPESRGLLSEKHWELILTEVLGLSSENAYQFTRWIQQGHETDKAKDISSNEIARVVSLMLREVSQKRKIILIIEDMHKVDHATFKLLLLIRYHLSSSADCRLFFILTSRWGQNTPARNNLHINQSARKDEDGSWADTLGRMIDEVDVQSNIFLNVFDADEAIKLLRETIDGLSAEQAREIISQVGTSPFNLKEALLFLEESNGAIMRYADGSGYRLRFGEDIDKKIRNAELKNTTKERLKLAKDHSGSVADLLDYGACSGSLFNYQQIENVLSKYGVDELEDAFSYCERFDILREIPLKPEQVEFSHDLLRDTLIDLIPSRKQRRVASHLLDEAVYNSHLEQAELCYQAGRWEEQIRITEKILEDHDAPVRVRLIASLLQILSLDERTEWRLLPDILFLNWNTAVRAQKSSVTSYRFMLPEHRVQLLESYTAAIQAMRGVSSSSNILWERLASAGALLASELKAYVQLNLFNYYTGCYWFDDMQFQRALEIFEQVEASEKKHNTNAPDTKDTINISAKLLASELQKKEIVEWVSEEGKWVPGDHNEDQRQDNLLYLSFCHRHLANPEKCLEYMSQALQLRRPGQWRVVGQALANTGALYLHSDLQMTRKFWQRGLDVATFSGHRPHQTEFTINMAHLDILDGNYKSAANLLNEGAFLAKQYGLTGQEIRASIHRGCLDLKQEQLSSARQQFDQVLEEAITHSYERRLWRIRANLATVYEAASSMDQALWCDTACVTKMAPITAIENSSGQKRLLWNITRASCALGNIGLRQMAYLEYNSIVKALTSEQSFVSQKIANAVLHNNLEELGGLANFLMDIKGRKRFLVTD
uniref:AAA ATPase domain-containing protein n=1 Tax=Candidatus Kentrum sp. LFY TaxID=2126342 RepID=A0A450UIX0_9GAMM|nr:MAG: AAA ATPase domain-containing protein [Candidatus Kentron sp. LFY]